MSRNKPKQPNNAWYWHSVKIIRAAIIASQAANLERKQIIDAIMIAYPFGQRAMWPYKNWLIAREHMLREFGLLLPGFLQKEAEAKRLKAEDLAGNPLFQSIGVQQTIEQ